MLSSRVLKGSLTGAVLWISLLALGANSVQAQPPELVLSGDNTGVGFSDQQGIRIPVYLESYFDSVAGFQFWIQLNRPDLIVFPGDTGSGTILIDTVCWKCNVWDGPDCIDSSQIPYIPPGTDCDWIAIDTFVFNTAAIDTVGTLVSGWEFVTARSLSGLGYDLLVTGIADLIGGNSVPPIPPQGGTIPLVYLIADVQTVPDEMTNQSVELHIQTDLLSNFCFSTPQGDCIGFVQCVTPDTNYFVCNLWQGDVCLDWQQVPGPPADSIEVVFDTTACLDTLAVVTNDGSVYVALCGDVNGDSEVNVQDLSDLIDFLFRPPAVIIPSAANVDGIIGPGGMIDVADLSYFVSYLFQGGPPLRCY